MKFQYLLTAFLALAALTATAQDNPDYDEALARKLGADDYGMKPYVFCILKTGTATITDQAQRDSIFTGHMANIDRLAKEGKLVVAGPFANGGDKRGLFIFNVATVEEAKQLVETDPVIQSGLMVYELTQWYGSAALPELAPIEKKIAKKKP